MPRNQLLHSPIEFITKEELEEKLEDHAIRELIQEYKTSKCRFYSRMKELGVTSPRKQGGRLAPKNMPREWQEQQLALDNKERSKLLARWR